MSIKFKLIFIIVAVLAFVGLLSGAFIYWQNTKILTKHLNSDIKETINQTTQLVNFYINRAESNITNLATDPLILEALETKDPAKFDQVSAKLTTIKNSLDTVENLALMEINNASCTPRAANLAAAAVLGRDFSDRDYCQGILKTKSTYLSSAFVSAVNNLPVLGIAIPIKNDKGLMLGFVYGSLNLNELRGYLWDLQVDSKVELLDRYGVMFLNTEEKIEKLGELMETEKLELRRIQDGLTKGPKEGVFQDEDNFVGYKAVGPITVIYEKSASKLLSMVRTVNLLIFASLLLALLLTLLVVYFFVGKVTQRISRLSHITQEIAGGKFSIELDKKDLTAKDETAILARSFNVMALKLKDLYDNLDNKVKERTQKLEQSEAETKKALDEAQRLNNLMVGRELEMVKLKEELKKVNKT
ncbi:MAG: HAMP domain-containing protein [Candidatus Paceibacterota bacterium]